MGRTHSGNQCSRKRQQNTEYCGSHLISQPYGRIDKPSPYDNKPQKKRGRPPKKLISVKDEFQDPNEIFAKNYTKSEKNKANNKDNNKKVSGISIDSLDLEKILPNIDQPEEEVTQVNFRMLEIDGKSIIIDDDTGKIYDMPEDISSGTIDIADLHLIGNLEPNGDLMFI